MTDLGVATRVHGRADDALAWYRLYRNIWLHDRLGYPWGQPDKANRHFLMALSWRSRWSTLREIIDAEERRAVAA